MTPSVDDTRETVDRWMPRPRGLSTNRVASTGADVAASENAAAAVAPVPGSLAMLLSAHILHDGELVLLIMRPSMWFIPLSSLRFIAVVLIAMIAMMLWGQETNHRTYIDIAAVVIVVRLAFAVLAWMGRLYVLTDLRILRLSGVFAVDVFDCPLRKVARVRLTYSLKERLFGVGSIDIIPAVPDMRPTVWSTVAKPVEVHETVVAAINRAKQTGLGCE